MDIWKILLGVLLGATILVSISYAASFPPSDDSFLPLLEPVHINHGKDKKIILSDGFGYLKFDLNDVNRVWSVEKAWLRVYLVEASYGEITIHKVLGNWEESTLMSAPDFAPDSLASVHVSPNKIGKFISFDITTLVQAWVNHSSPNYGIVLQIIDKQENQKTIISSKEDRSHSPELEIIFKGTKGETGNDGGPGPDGKDSEIPGPQVELTCKTDFRRAESNLRGACTGLCGGTDYIVAMSSGSQISNIRTTYCAIHFENGDWCGTSSGSPLATCCICSSVPLP